MSRNRQREYHKYDSEHDRESINCCQLDVHKQLIRERYASKYETNPVDLFSKRQCTDIFCLFIFLAALIGWIVVSVIVFRNGGPQKLLASIDSNNRRCGFDKGVEDRPNMFFFDITRCLPPRSNFFFCDTKQVCVKECPKTNFSASYYLKNNVPLWSIKQKLICIDEFAKDFQINSHEDVRNAIRAGYCAEWYMESEPIFRRCIPKKSVMKTYNFSFGFKSNNSEAYITDFQIMFDSILSFIYDFITVDIDVHQLNLSYRNFNDLDFKFYTLVSVILVANLLANAFYILLFFSLHVHFILLSSLLFSLLSSFSIHSSMPWFYALDARLCLPRFPSSKFRSDAFATVSLPDSAIVELRGITTKLIKSAMNEVKRTDEFIQKVGEDLLNTWPWILAFMCLAMFSSFIFVIIMKWISGIMVWTSVVALIGLLGFSSYYTWQNYTETRNQKGVLHSSKTIIFANLRTNISLLESDLLKHEYTWLALFILSVGALVIIVIILIFLRNRLRLAIQLIKEGSKAVSYAWSSLIFPSFPWALQILLFAQGALIFCYLLGERVPIYRISGLNGSQCTCNNGYKEGDICDADTFKNSCNDLYGNPCVAASCAFSSNESETFTIYLHLFNLLMLLWCEYFVSGFSQISLAMTFATYYWISAKRKLPCFIMGTSVMRVLQYHLGTVAFGSFLLALLNWVRILVEVCYRYINKNDNAVIRCVRCCCGCFLACLHRILRILTKNAYIMCAMKGTNYCVSAKNAFDLIIKNIIRASVLDGVTTFLFFIMKLLITVSMGVLAYFFFSRPIPDLSNIRDENYQLDYYFVPILIVCLGTFFISSLFFGVYSTAVDTIFLCALEDLEKNDGSPEKPYVMSKSLIKIFKVKNKKPNSVS